MIALLTKWIEEDYTEDPEEIARRDADWEKLRSNLEANSFHLPIPDIGE